MLQRQARATGTPVFIIQHDGAPGHCLARGSEDWQIRREVAPIEDDIVVNKSHKDAFLDTDLTSQLEARGVTHLVMTGYMNQ